MNEAPAQRRRVNPGEMLHGYRVRKALGDGAFSRVYLVEDSDTHTAYALKHVIAENDKEDRWVDQIRAEWEIGRKLDHPAIRKLVDCRFEGWFLKKSRDVGLIMELIDAESLADLQRPPITECLTIFHDVASALVHMHERGFIHADMKPLNILYTDDRRTKVIDLGQAVKIDTRKERIQGTPGYIAPEQARRELLSAQTDVFNFAATVYSILLGVQPSGQQLLAPQAAANSASPTSGVPPERIGPSGALHLVDPTIPEALSILLLDCLDPLPHKRKRMPWVLKVLTQLIAERQSAGASAAGLIRATPR